jgi:hypothetical protein
MDYRTSRLTKHWCTSERLKALAIQHLYQLDLALSPPD